MITINQTQRLKCDVKTVDWLIENTDVRFFDPVNLSGYQRNIDERQCDKIIDYALNNPFYFPTAIICACDGDYDPQARLRVVDGQHRIEAFRRIKKDYPEEYKKIKESEVPVVILEKADEKVEVNTFITINKTAKKVDTSLAIVLKSKLESGNNSDQLAMTRMLYLAIQTAWRISVDEKSPDFDKKYWQNQVSFEKQSGEQAVISLNAFARSFGRLIAKLEKTGVIPAKWTSKPECDCQTDFLVDFFNCIWETIIQDKWPSLFSMDGAQKKIIQGPIGFSSINRYLGRRIEGESVALNKNNLFEKTVLWIKEINIDDERWLPGKEFASFTSESGYSHIADELFYSIKGC